MISIQLESGILDTYINTEVAFSWTGVRFQESLRDAFSNDIAIPKTPSNISALEAVGLLDSLTQPLGTKVNAVLYCNSQAMPVKLQVTSVTANELNICLYEQVFSSIFKDVNLNDYFVDDDSSIYRWNTNSVGDYPTVFHPYAYGMPYNTLYAQYHPSLPLRSRILEIEAAENISLPHVHYNWMLLATKKTVCPQNKKQVIEASWSNNRLATLNGGQQICNDMLWSWSPDMTKITFNRSCRLHIDGYIAFNIWSGRLGARYVEYILDSAENVPTQAYQVNLRSDIYSVDVQYAPYDSPATYITKGTTFSLRCPDYNDFRDINATLVFTIDDYDIFDSDYGEELIYVGRTPRLKVPNYWDNSLINQPFDGSTLTYSRNGLTTASITLPSESLAYFGYYCNLPEIPLIDLFSSLQWLTGQKIVLDQDGSMHWDDFSGVEIEGNITEIRPRSDKLAKKNYISVGGVKKLVCEIQNDWLEEEKTLYELIFEYITGNYGEDYIPQYKNPQTDEDGVPSVEFNELENVVLANWVYNYNSLYPIPYNMLGFNNMNQAVEVDIETHSAGVKDNDIIYLDGRKFYVIEGDIDLTTGISNITCLLAPNQNNTTRQ